MQVHVTFKNIDSKESLKERATEKSEKFKNFLKSPVNVQFIFQEDKVDSLVELVVTGEGQRYVSNVRAGDFYSGIDESVDKVITQLKKHKEKQKNHKGFKKASETMTEESEDEE